MSSFRAYVRLVRLPAVFTAMADVLLGYLLQHGSYEPPLQVASLLVASSCLYMAGMALNDAFDHHRDSLTRPNRPIPSGKISVRSAVAVSVLLLALGSLAAGTVSPNSLAIAGLLIVAILIYNSAAKVTLAGPAVMGACRFLNVMLGASAHEEFAAVWTAPQLWIALGMGTYVAGVTLFARRESNESRFHELAAAMIVCNLGFAGLAACLHKWPGAQPASVTLFLLVVVALTVNRRMISAVFSPAPQRVQSAVRIALLSLITLDATLALTATKAPANALIIVALLVPALALGRIASTT